MNDNREPGKIILINGASSAGKSTLSRALQQIVTKEELFYGE
jgi:chloramphenicol 3-O-phosphotransferase